LLGTLTTKQLPAAPNDLVEGRGEINKLVLVRPWREEVLSSQRKSWITGYTSSVSHNHAFRRSRGITSHRHCRTSCRPSRYLHIKIASSFRCHMLAGFKSTSMESWGVRCKQTKYYIHDNSPSVSHGDRQSTSTASLQKRRIPWPPG